MRLPILSVLVAASVLAASCTPATEETAEENGEAAEEAIGVPLTEPDETDAPTRTAAQPLDVAQISTLIDVRGVGDSGWAKTHQSTPIAAELGKALDRFDATGHAYKAHVSFLNWETVVGDSCPRFANVYSPGKSYAFLSRPENLTQAYDRGFNLVGLSNNHSRDCSNGGGETTSSRMSVTALEAMADNAWIFAGMSAREEDKSKAKVRTFTIKGKPVRVAFASVYTGRASCPLATCQGDTEAILKSLRDVPADLRIIALHSQDSQPALLKTGTDFIEKYNGDVVFGHGPHVWKPVHIVRKADGRKGAFFESLGNFLHPGCAGQTRNFIGRALFDSSFTLKQVQLVPVENSGINVKLSAVNGTEVPANLSWSPTGRGRGVYANIKR